MESGRGQIGVIQRREIGKTDTDYARIYDDKKQLVWRGLEICELVDGYDHWTR